MCFTELWSSWNILYSPFIFCETFFFKYEKHMCEKKRIVCRVSTNIKIRRCEKHMTKKWRKSREIKTSLYRYSIQGVNSTNKHNSQLGILKGRNPDPQPQPVNPERMPPHPVLIQNGMGGHPVFWKIFFSIFSSFRDFLWLKWEKNHFCSIQEKKGCFKAQDT